MIERQLPNLITIVRILLVAPLGWALLSHSFVYGLMIFIIAALSDFLDGFLARRFNWQSWLGAVLDPVADKLLLVTSYVVLGINGFVPWWLVIAVALRDGVIVGGAFAFWWVTGAFRAEPTLLSKLNTLLQLALALAAILAYGLHWLPLWSADLFIYAVLASTLLSGIHYVGIWSRRAWQHTRV